MTSFCAIFKNSSLQKMIFNDPHENFRRWWNELSKFDFKFIVSSINFSDFQVTPSRRNEGVNNVFLCSTRSNWWHKFCQNVWTLPATCFYLPIYIKSKINFLSPKFEFPAQTTSRSSLRLIHTRAFDACGCSGKLEKFLSLRQCDCLPQPHVSNVHYVNVPVLG